MNNTNLSSRVANLNPPWNGDESEQASNAHFQKAMQLTGQEFMDALQYYSKVSGVSSIQVLGLLLFVLLAVCIPVIGEQCTRCCINLCR